MDPYQRLKEKFKCPKCNSKISISKVVTLSKVSEKLLGGHPDKYLFISCSLCGYTETYNLKIVAGATESEPVPGSVPEPREG